MPSPDDFWQKLKARAEALLKEDNPSAEKLRKAFNYGTERAAKDRGITPAQAKVLQGMVKPALEAAQAREKANPPQKAEDTKPPAKPSKPGELLGDLEKAMGGKPASPPIAPLRGDPNKKSDNINKATEQKDASNTYRNESEDGKAPVSVQQDKLQKSAPQAHVKNTGRVGIADAKGAKLEPAVGPGEGIDKTHYGKQSVSKIVEEGLGRNGPVSEWQMPLDPPMRQALKNLKGKTPGPPDVPDDMRGVVTRDTYRSPAELAKLVAEEGSDLPRGLQYPGKLGPWSGEQLQRAKAIPPNNIPGLSPEDATANTGSKAGEYARGYVRDIKGHKVWTAGAGVPQSGDTIRDATGLSMRQTMENQGLAGPNAGARQYGPAGTIDLTQAAKQWDTNFPALAASDPNSLTLPGKLNRLGALLQSAAAKRPVMYGPGNTEAVPYNPTSTIPGNLGPSRAQSAGQFIGAGPGQIRWIVNPEDNKYGLKQFQKIDPGPMANSNINYGPDMDPALADQKVDVTEFRGGYGDPLRMQEVGRRQLASDWRAYEPITPDPQEIARRNALANQLNRYTRSVPGARGGVNIEPMSADPYLARAASNLSVFSHGATTPELPPVPGIGSPGMVEQLRWPPTIQYGNANGVVLPDGRLRNVLQFEQLKGSPSQAEPTDRPFSASPVSELEETDRGPKMKTNWYREPKQVNLGGPPAGPVSSSQAYRENTNYGEHIRPVNEAGTHIVLRPERPIPGVASGQLVPGPESNAPLQPSSPTRWLADTGPGTGINMPRLRELVENVAQDPGLRQEPPPPKYQEFQGELYPIGDANRMHDANVQAFANRLAAEDARIQAQGGTPFGGSKGIPMTEGVKRPPSIKGLSIMDSTYQETNPGAAEGRRDFAKPGYGADKFNPAPEGLEAHPVLEDMNMGVIPGGADPVGGVKAYNTLMGQAGETAAQTPWGQAASNPGNGLLSRFATEGLPNAGRLGTNLMRAMPLLGGIQSAGEAWANNAPAETIANQAALGTGIAGGAGWALQKLPWMAPVLAGADAMNKVSGSNAGMGWNLPTMAGGLLGGAAAALDAPAALAAGIGWGTGSAAEPWLRPGLQSALGVTQGDGSSNFADPQRAAYAQLRLLNRHGQQY